MKLGVCVPYRNREKHLHEFIPKVGKFLKERNIEFCMYFGHQCDDKLFNRGAMKNVAAEFAFKDGCDYIVWHDIDMIPENDTCDYSYPAENPRHIAISISQSDYQLKYQEYFGGAVLFTKEQAYKTNGYSNNYWDWGMEDDDLFWRCHLEGYTDVRKADLPRYNQYYRFNGENSLIEIPSKVLKPNFFKKDFKISVLVRAEHQQHKAPIHLIGTPDADFVEFPILRIPGYDFGFAYNNSRAMTLQFWNTFNQHNYMWLKRYANQWSWLTAEFNIKDKLCHFYLNGIEADARAGHGTQSPLNWKGQLYNYKNQNIYLGHTPSFDKNHPGSYFKGDIGELIIESRGREIYKLTEDTSFKSKNVKLIEKDDMVINHSIIPHRVDGRFRCLPHETEGLVDGKWIKGETTAENERKYVLKMQQGKHRYKKDGLNSLKYTFLEEKKLTPWAKLINVKL
jgi:hypothetical protein